MGTPARNGQFKGRKPSSSSSSAPGAKGSAEHEILFQNYFKSVGPRTYAAQVKRAGNGNHYLVLTEGKRDEKTNEVWKTKLYIYSEDFIEFFKMVKGAAEFIKANPVPPDVEKKRKRFWAKNVADPGPKTSPEAVRPDAGRAGSEAAAAPSGTATGTAVGPP